MQIISLNTIKAFSFLINKADGLVNHIKLLKILITSKIPFAKKATEPVDIKFKDFYLRFLPGQGELTPFEEIKVLSTELFPMSDIAEWTVIDCGANIGLFSLIFKDAAFIIAVEPSPNTYSRLSYNFKKNGIKGSVLNNAVSSQDGELAMNIGESSSVTAQVSANGNFIVKALTLDRIISQHNLKVVNLLKLDVEDHETEVLIGAKNSLNSHLIKQVFFEYRTKEALKDIENYLSTFGYSRTFISSQNCGNGLWSVNLPG